MPLDRPLIVASSSPRRQYLMKEAGFNFTIEKPDVDESFPPDLPVDQVAKYLAEKKAEYFRLTMQDEVVVTADTVVILQDKINLRTGLKPSICLAVFQDVPIT